MAHIDEYTLELYALDADEITLQRAEIEKHIQECYGCRQIVDRIVAFYSSAEKEFQRTASENDGTAEALVRVGTRVQPRYQSGSAAIPFRPVTRFQQVQHFVRRHPVITGSGTFAALAGLALLFNNTLTTLNRDKNPTYKYYNVAQGVIEIRNSKNEVLWKLPSPHLQEVIDDEELHTKQTVVTDLNGDGKNEVLTTLNVAGEENPKTLKIFDAEQTIRRKLSFNQPFQYEGKNNYTSIFNPDVFLFAGMERALKKYFSP